MAAALVVQPCPAQSRILEFIIGADVSWIPEYEADGFRFAQNGVERDPLEIFSLNGFNWIRLRIFHNPLAAGGYAEGQGEPFCGLENTVAMAKRIKGLGLNLLLDFHYSDNWADPGKQYTPAAWKDLPFEVLGDSVYNYTHFVLDRLSKEGLAPQMVQVGNEINNGLLWPQGSEIDSAALLVARGLQAVKDFDPLILTMVHSATGGDFGTSDWFIESMLASGGPIDVLGLSCYTEWHGTPEEWRVNFSQLAEKYPSLYFMIAEYSHEKEAAHQIMFDMEDGRGLGAFIWEPITWMEAIFDQRGNRYEANELLDQYPVFAEKFIIPGAGLSNGRHPFQDAQKSFRLHYFQGNILIRGVDSMANLGPLFLISGKSLPRSPGFGKKVTY